MSLENPYARPDRVHPRPFPRGHELYYWIHPFYNVREFTGNPLGYRVYNPGTRRRPNRRLGTSKTRLVMGPKIRASPAVMPAIHTRNPNRARTTYGNADGITGSKLARTSAYCAAVYSSTMTSPNDVSAWTLVFTVCKSTKFKNAAGSRRPTDRHWVARGLMTIAIARSNLKATSGHSKAIRDKRSIADAVSTPVAMSNSSRRVLSSMRGTFVSWMNCKRNFPDDNLNFTGTRCPERRSTTSPLGIFISGV